MTSSSSRTSVSFSVRPLESGTPPASLVLGARRPRFFIDFDAEEASLFDEEVDFASALESPDAEPSASAAAAVDLAEEDLSAEADFPDFEAADFLRLEFTPAEDSFSGCGTSFSDFLDEFGIRRTGSGFADGGDLRQEIQRAGDLMVTHGQVSRTYRTQDL